MDSPVTPIVKNGLFVIPRANVTVFEVSADSGRRQPSTRKGKLTEGHYFFLPDA
jgi:hypothetical protein